MNETRDEVFVPRKKFKFFHKNEDKSGNETEENVLSSSIAQNEAGSYFLGPTITKYVRSPVPVCLGRKKGTDKYYLMKMLILDDSNTSDRGLYLRRTVFHNEYTVLSLLKNVEGIIQLQEFFKEHIYREVQGTRQKLKRVCMAMECVVPHGPYNSELIPLNQFLKEEQLTETEALTILYHLLLVIENMQKKNIMHRDIKLSNIILNRKTFKVKLMDFYYAKIVSSSCKPENKAMTSCCLPESNDVWAAGVVFYALLCSGISKFGSILSFIRSTQDLYLKLKENKCNLLKSSSLSAGIKEILHCILCPPQFRLKASEALDMVSTVIAICSSSQNPSLSGGNRNSDQVVPECSDFDCQNHQDEKQSKRSKSHTLEVPEMPDVSKTTDVNEPSREKVQPASDVISIVRYTSGRAISCKAKENELLDREDIKFAMMRLGATSLHNIKALSFNYTKRNSCPS